MGTTDLLPGLQEFVLDEVLTEGGSIASLVRKI